jgi:hypothetical protein
METTERGQGMAQYQDADDHRYAYVECVSCGQRHQLIDFYGSHHRILCAKPVLDRATLPRGVNLG